ncbi:MAG TPA: VOC family protein [Burkholderiaceae bacterium]|nr:VOC family protein [Burkholderiaceae bacterium]
MSRFRVDGLDHVHVYVRDRAEAAKWYGSVLGFRRDARFGSWAREIGGPLTLTAGDGLTHVALFEDAKRAGKATTMALRVDGASFVSFHKRAAQLPLFDKRRRPSSPHLQDHALSLSLYFNDRDGNPIELTTYEVDLVRARVNRI